MFFQTTPPPCGLGGSQNQSGPCTGTYTGTPSSAGSGVFDGISTSGPTGALLAAGVILVGLLFAYWATRRVATFFGAKPGKPDADFSDGALIDHGSAPTSEWAGSQAPLMIGDGDSEDDSEDDSEMSDEEFEAADHERESKESNDDAPDDRYGTPEELAEWHADHEFERMHDEYERERNGE